MSGTSLDGVDVAIVDFNTSTPCLVSTYFNKYPDPLLTALKSACINSVIEFDNLGHLDAQLGCFYAQCVHNALSKAKLTTQDISAIGSHGQTIQHSPNCTPKHTLQIGDANRIAEETGVTVVADFRRRDIAAGGQGAPLVPAFHQAMFQSDTQSRAIVNIGGIANITLLSKAAETPIIGFDCGPGNTLMDQWCQKHVNQPFDVDGRLSKKGGVNSALLNSLLNETYFSKAHPKSTGPEYFNLDWLQPHIDKHPTNVTDTLSTLCELTAQSISQSLKQLPTVDKVLICGGGVHNKHLMVRLNSLLNDTVSTTEPYGINPDWVEAVAFAWLAKQTMEGRTGNIPSVTGAKKAVILGAIYPA